MNKVYVTANSKHHNEATDWCLNNIPDPYYPEGENYRDHSLWSYNVIGTSEGLPIVLYSFVDESTAIEFALRFA